VEAPNPKLQAPKKHQASSSKRRGDRSGLWCLAFGFWSLFGAWNLELGTFMKFQTAISKLQTNTKPQAPSPWATALIFGVWRLDLGACLDFGAWNLELF
jgi:hypothetical protein